MIRFLLTALLASACADAGAAKLDDSASPRQRVDAKPRWIFEGEDALGQERIGRMIVEVPNLELRLNTSSYVGKHARIYLTLPSLIPGVVAPEGLRAEWRTRGAMLAGSISPGGRTLVYDGQINQPQTVAFFDFVIHLDARFTYRGIRFEPQFDIEVSP